VAGSGGGSSDGLYRFDTTAGPLLSPYDSGMVDVGLGHEVFYAQYGNPDGRSVLRFHGGPGGASSDVMSRIIDPATDRLVVFDSPGCGRSVPSGPGPGVGTPFVAAAADAVADRVGVDVWDALFGASWGSTAALVYAQHSPDRVRSVLVSGVFLADETSLRWWWTGVGAVYPEVVAARTGFLGLPFDAHWSDVRRGFIDAADDVDAWRVLYTTESWTLSSFPSDVVFDPVADADYMRMFVHFSANDFFLRPFQVLEDMPRMAGVRLAVVNGREDFCTPPLDAYRLACAAGVQPLIVPGAGHSLAYNGVLLAQLRRSLAGLLD